MVAAMSDHTEKLKAATVNSFKSAGIWPYQPTKLEKMIKMESSKVSKTVNIVIDVLRPELERIRERQEKKDKRDKQKKERKRSGFSTEYAAVLTDHEQLKALTIANTLKVVKSMKKEEVQGYMLTTLGMEEERMKENGKFKNKPELLLMIEEEFERKKSEFTQEVKQRLEAEKIKLLPQIEL